MSFLEIDEDRLKAQYYRAWIENGHKPVAPHQDVFLEQAVIQYMKVNHCSYDHAWMIAQGGVF